MPFFAFFKLYITSLPNCKYLQLGAGPQAFHTNLQCIISHSSIFKHELTFGNKFSCFQNIVAYFLACSYFTSNPCRVS